MAVEAQQWVAGQSQPAGSKSEPKSIYGQIESLEQGKVSGRRWRAMASRRRTLSCCTGAEKQRSHWCRSRNGEQRKSRCSGPFVSNWFYSIDGTRSAVKIARSVWSWGKSGGAHTPNDYLWLLQLYIRTTPSALSPV